MRGFSIVLVCATLAGTFVIRPAAAEPCALRLGWSTFAPFQMPGRDGVPDGLDMDIFRHVAKAAGCTIAEYRRAPWGRLLKEVELGRIDAVLSASFTEERNAFGRYSQAYRSVVYAAVFHGKAPAEAGPLPADRLLAGHPRIGVYHDAYLPAPVMAEVKRAEGADRVYSGYSYEKMIDLLEIGRLDTVLLEVVKPDCTFPKIDNDPAFKVVPFAGTAGQLHVLFSRRTVEAETVARISAAIRRFVGSDGYKALFRKYLRR